MSKLVIITKNEEVMTFTSEFNFFPRIQEKLKVYKLNILKEDDKCRLIQVLC